MFFCFFNYEHIVSASLFDHCGAQDVHDTDSETDVGTDIDADTTLDANTDTNDTSTSTSAFGDIRRDKR